MEVREEAWTGYYQVCTAIVVIGGIMVLGLVIGHYRNADVVRV